MSPGSSSLGKRIGKPPRLERGDPTIATDQRVERGVEGRRVRRAAERLLRIVAEPHHRARPGRGILGIAPEVARKKLAAFARELGRERVLDVNETVAHEALLQCLYGDGDHSLQFRLSESASITPISPPIEPMLAKLAEELPEGDGCLYEPKWDGFRAIVFRGGRRLHPEPRPAAVRSLLPRAARRARCAASGRCVLDGEIVIPRRTASTSTRCSCAFTLRPRASRSWPRRRRPRSSRSICWPSTAAIFATRRRASGARRLERRSRGRAAGASDAGDPRSRAGARWLDHFEGAGLDGVIAKPMTASISPASAR